MIMTEKRRVRRDRVDPGQVLALLRDLRLTGHGGGGFPTATKISAARGRKAEVIINACDGEPLVHKDSALLRHQPLLVADGIAIIQELVRPRRTMIAVHADSPAEPAAHDLIRTGEIDAEVLAVPDRYVSSEASALASLASGGEARPLYHEQPLTTTIPGRPRRSALILNAETVARVAAACLSGVSTPTRLITLAGDVRQSGVFEVPFTARLADLVGGAGTSGQPRAALIGGYGGRWFAWSDLQERTLGDLGSSIGAGLIMVHADGCPLRTVGAILAYLAEQSAGQCGPCMFGLPAIAADWQLLTQPHRATDPRGVGSAEARLRGRLPVISGRGACHHPDGAVTMTASALTVFASDLVAHRRGHCVRSSALASRG